MKINMTKKKLQDQIISDLEKDFPDIKEIKKENDEIIIKADDDILWEIFEILYTGLDNVELNMGKDKETHIIIKT
ncbi:MAG: hypothetical protein BZ138_03830 [Methanosphaera sp. rholeuAM270]|nr:MAG: hypothetical protein BZ138_03830 [Methanosphaera sp. rholeuAM270]